MKKVFLAGVLFAAALPASSQLRLGITAGGVASKTNMATFSANKPGIGSQSISSDYRFGFFAGITAEKEFGNVSIRPQVYFIEKGDALHFKNSGGSSAGTNLFAADYKDVYSFNYVELPVNIVYNVFTSRGKFFIGGGPAIAIATNASHKKAGTPRQDMDFYVDNLNRFDFSLNIMAGYEFKAGWFVDANYIYGFHDFYNEVTTKNRAFTLGIGKFIKQ